MDENPSAAARRAGALEGCRSDLRGIAGGVTEVDVAMRQNRLERWKERTLRTLSPLVAVKEAKALEARFKAPKYLVHSPLRTFLDDVDECESLLAAITEELEAHADEVLPSPRTK